MIKLDCPVPIPVWIVIVSIVGSIVAIGLIILLGIKIIIIIIQRRETAKFLKDKPEWGKGQNPLYNPPETQHSTSGYAAGYRGTNN
jgi:hypothetical protein